MSASASGPRFHQAGALASSVPLKEDAHEESPAAPRTLRGGARHGIRPDLDLLVNFNILVFTGTAYSQIGCNLVPGLGPHTMSSGVTPADVTCGGMGT
jgi:hypothetical protein